jgi:hypothetical protein
MIFYNLRYCLQGLSVGIVGHVLLYLRHHDSINYDHSTNNKFSSQYVLRISVWLESESPTDSQQYFCRVIA